MEKITIDERIKKFRQQSKIEITRTKNELDVKEKILKATGLEFIVVMHYDKTTSVFIENSRFDPQPKFDRQLIKMYYTSIKKALSLKPENSELRYASRDNIVTSAPALIEFTNNTSDIVFRHPQEVKITFPFKGGLNLTFRMPMTTDGSVFAENLIQTEVLYTKPKTKDGWPKNLYSLKTFGSSKVYPNDFWVYCDSAKRKKDFMNICFYGKPEGRK